MYLRSGVLACAQQGQGPGLLGKPRLPIWLLAGGYGGLGSFGRGARALRVPRGSGELALLCVPVPWIDGALSAHGLGTVGRACSDGSRPC